MDYILKITDEGEHSLETSYTGADLLSRPLYNKGSSFTRDERKTFGLAGLLPSHVSTIEEQSTRMYEEIRRLESPLDQFIALNALQNRNEILFYKILFDHLEEFMPVVYTPTVGLACQQFSKIFTKVRGLWITPDDAGNIEALLKNYPFQDIRLIVATDNERILGLGDLGAGGIGIPIGKLSLYTVAAGIHPSHTLPISLDVGTDNPKLLNDPLYLGWKNARLRGEAYYSFIDEFVAAVKTCFPKAVLQWEDFKKNNAFTVLNKYRHALPSFNDDIQGTAAVALAGVLSGCKISNSSYKSQRILILGAGAAGVGISKLMKSRWLSEGIHESEIHHRILLVDSQGILTQSTPELDPLKAEFAWPKDMLAHYQLSETSSLMDIIKKFKPTVLLGTSGQADAFTEEMVLEMHRHTERPMVFPLSNPTSHSEANPNDVMRWTKNQAIIATGSPFDGFSQGNNVYIYPAVGLAALLMEVKLIEDSLFSSAAAALADLVTPVDLKNNRIYPEISRLREISVYLAEQICVDHGMKREEAKLKIKNFAWIPKYPSYVRSK